MSSSTSFKPQPMQESKFGPMRRIVTGHHPTDTDGSQVQLHDTSLPLKCILDGRAHIHGLYSSLGVPTTSPHTSSPEEVKAAADKVQGVVVSGGTNGQVTDLMPNCGVGMHRTNSVDYNIFLKGSAWLVTPERGAKGGKRSGLSNGVNGVEKEEAMEGEGHPNAQDGEVWTLVKAGEMVVQRGTIHAWHAGPEGARWVTVVVAAEPVKVISTGEELGEKDFD